eukprot:TRINITY_DN4106_c0_g1_i1.p1 TRINITY_DN4106_c0_g1~~TRINITY_DN4106_c0_g1_i1.p1  ORF type:complete len:142 (-),score=11.96 TRINITY_DN4106_c0_g1_i1:33-458(-)
MLQNSQRRGGQSPPRPVAEPPIRSAGRHNTTERKPNTQAASGGRGTLPPTPQGATPPPPPHSSGCKPRMAATSCAASPSRSTRSRTSHVFHAAAGQPAAATNTRAISPRVNRPTAVSPCSIATARHGGDSPSTSAVARTMA